MEYLSTLTPKVIYNNPNVGKYSIHGSLGIHIPNDLWQKLTGQTFDMSRRGGGGRMIWTTRATSTRQKNMSRDHRIL
jgi:hypothetical protein